MTGDDTDDMVLACSLQAYSAIPGLLSNRTAAPSSALAGHQGEPWQQAGETCWRQEEMHTCVALPAATRPAATGAATAKQKPCITGMPCIRACNATTAEYVCLQAVWKMGACSAPAQ